MEMELRGELRQWSKPAPKGRWTTWDVGLELEGRLGCGIGPYRDDPRLGRTDCGFSPSPMSTASTQNIVPFPQLRDQAGYVTSGVATVVRCL